MLALFPVAVLEVIYEPASLDRARLTRRGARTKPQPSEARPRSPSAWCQRIALCQLNDIVLITESTAMSKAKCSFLDFDYSSGEGEEAKEAAPSKAKTGEGKKSERKKAADDLRAAVLGRPTSKKGAKKSGTPVHHPGGGGVAAEPSGAAAAAAFRLEQSRLQTFEAELAEAVTASLAVSSSTHTRDGPKQRAKKPPGLGESTATPAVVDRIVREELAKERMRIEIEEEQRSRQASGAVVGSAASSETGAPGRAPPGLARSPVKPGARNATPAPAVSVPPSIEAPLRLLSIPEAATLPDPAQLLPYYALATTELQRLQDENADLALRVAELSAALRLAVPGWAGIA